MIQIIDKIQCVGCGACAQICGVKCITMTEDHEGFLYPVADKNSCTNCGLCEKVCPVLFQQKEAAPLKKYAAKNREETIRNESSSGGVFTLLAEKVITQGGIVFGVRFNEKWELIHAFTDNIEELALFRGSKYVQSRMGDCYLEAKEFLKQGRKVLFSGTPCQIAGLRLFLKKEYENLLAVDFICHGTPSPGVWAIHKNQSVGLDSIKKISFRDKSDGWRAYSLRIETSRETILQDLKTNPYLIGFQQNLYLRPSCYQCPAKSFKSRSDITLADFWAVKKYLPEIDDNKGVSLITTNSEKGEGIFCQLASESIEIPEVTLQKMSYASCKQHPRRNEFFERYKSASSLDALIKELTYVSPFKKRVERIKTLAKAALKKILRLK